MAVMEEMEDPEYPLINDISFTIKEKEAYPDLSKTYLFTNKNVYVNKQEILRGERGDPGDDGMQGLPGDAADPIVMQKGE